MKESHQIKQQRAKRIRELREKSGLKRREFSKKYNIPETTLKYWESGLCENIRLNSLELLINALANEGIPCTVEWIMHGNEKLSIANPLKQKLMFEDLHAITKNEIAFLYNLYPDGIHITATDNAMAPLIVKNDIVFGVVENLAKLDESDETNFIITTKNNESYIRQIKQTSMPALYALCHINEKFNGAVNLINRKDIKALYSILWIKKAAIYSSSQNK